MCVILSVSFRSVSPNSIMYALTCIPFTMITQTHRKSKSLQTARLHAIQRLCYYLLIFIAESGSSFFKTLVFYPDQNPKPKFCLTLFMVFSAIVLALSAPSRSMFFSSSLSLISLKFCLIGRSASLVISTSSFLRSPYP